MNSDTITTDTITVDVYDRQGKKLIEGVMTVNSVHGMAQVPMT